MRHYLFTTYHRSSNESRQQEYDFCVRKNLVAGFDRVYILVDNDLHMQEAHDKFDCEVINMSRRPTFADFFSFISTEEFSDSVNVVANTDIFFLNMQQINANLHRLKDGDACFALSRYDYHTNRPSSLYDRPDSQDCWIFLGNKWMVNLTDIDFTMGVAGCDNRLAHQLMVAGYEVSNPSRTIYTFHLHDVPVRTYTDGSGDAIHRIPPPYLLIQPTE